MPRKKLNNSVDSKYEKERRTKKQKNERESKRLCLLKESIVDAASKENKDGASFCQRSSHRLRSKKLAQQNSTQQSDSQQTDGSSEQDNTNIVVLGDMLPDDLINIFCQRLSAALNGRIEGMIAMQSILIEPEQCLQEISGRREVLQVLLDAELPHYILVEWRAEDRQVHVFDPLIRGGSSNFVEGRLTLRFRQQIAALFGHLFPDESTTSDGNEKTAACIPLVMQRQMQQQRDGWSCGLRSIGHLLLRAFNRNINDYDSSPSFYIDLPKVLDFIVRILGISHPAAEIFRDADLGKSLKIARKSKPICFLMNKDSLKLAPIELDHQADEEFANNGKESCDQSDH